MRETTSAWLGPMLTEAEARGLDTQRLMQQASMPAAEVEWPSPAQQRIASLAPPGARMMAVDWIRFGELLRGALGWEDYPAGPRELTQTGTLCQLSNHRPSILKGKDMTACIECDKEYDGGGRLHGDTDTQWTCDECWEQIEEQWGCDPDKLFPQVRVPPHLN